MRVQNTTWLAALGVALMSLRLLHPAEAAHSRQTGPTSASPSAVNGGISFHNHCAVCHGEHGRGNGPASSALIPRPPDLSRLTERSGTFPAEHVTAVLKGEDLVVAHGNQTMMIWGKLFLAEAHGDPSAADNRIADVVRFVQSLQASK